MRKSLLVLVFGSLFSLLGCDFTSDPEETRPADFFKGLGESLIGIDLWLESLPESDPFSDYAQEAGCRLESGVVELQEFEINTNACGYGSFSQTTLTDIQKGDTLRIVYSHSDLWFPEVTQGTLALALDESVVFEREIPIPSYADIQDERIVMTQEWESGTSITFHVRNHGLNTWGLGIVEILREDESLSL